MEPVCRGRLQGTSQVPNTLILAETLHPSSLLALRPVLVVGSISVVSHVPDKRPSWTWPWPSVSPQLLSTPGRRPSGRAAAGDAPPSLAHADRCCPGSCFSQDDDPLSVRPIGLCLDFPPAVIWRGHDTRRERESVF